MAVTKADGTSSVKSATRTLDILEYIVAHGQPASAAEIAATLGIPVSSLSYLLATLIERGYLTRSGRLHSPGPALARLAPQGGPTMLVERVRPVLRSLTLQLNESASFFVRHGNDMEAIASEVAPQPLRYTVETGRPLPLHAFASGKAILAALSEEELAAYFATSRRPSYTPLTRTDETVLRAQLAEIRQSGFARTSEEYTPGIIGIGHAVLDAKGALLGALSIAIPLARATPALEERAAALLLRASDTLGAG